MSINRVLDSIEFVLGPKTINVKAIDQIIENGEIITTRIHRGAYPLQPDGDIHPDLQEQIGFTLKNILGETLTNAVIQISELTSQMDQLIAVLSEKHEEINKLTEENSQLKKLIPNGEI